MGISVVVAVILVPLAMFTCAFCLLKNQMRSCAKRVGKRVAGVDVHLDSFSLSNGCKNPRMELHGLTIYNPIGYSTDHALKVDTLVLDAALGGWFASLGKALDITRLALHDLDLHLEFNLTGGSNLQDILNMLDKHASKPRDEEVENEGALVHQHLLTLNPYAKGGLHEHGVMCHPRCDCCHTESSNNKVNLHYVETKSIHGRISHSQSGIGAPFVVADIVIDDFASKTGAKGAAQVVRTILQTLIVTALQTAPGAMLSSASQRCCGGEAEDMVTPTSPGATWSVEKGRWFLGASS